VLAPDLQSSNQVVNLLSADMVVVRTVTASLAFDETDTDSTRRERIADASAVLHRVKELLETSETAQVDLVQTIRLSTNPVEQWLGFEKGETKVLEKARSLVEALNENAIQFASLGPVRKMENLPMVPKLLSLSKALNISADMGDAGETKGATQQALGWKRAQKIADTVLEVTGIETDGGANFRFCVTSNVTAGSPFFPASYFERNDQQTQFAIGLETSDLLVDAFEAACAATKDTDKDIMLACEEELIERYAKVLGPLQHACENAAESTGTLFLGIDASMNPSLGEKGIGSAFAMVLSQLCGESALFGSTGTLALSVIVTRSIQRAAEKSGAHLTGYSGLMLPQMEDLGLADAATEGSYTVRDLLLCSAVCGVGIDTVPIPGDVSPTKLALLLTDMRALSVRWTKPLSCRVLPIPRKTAGDLASFDQNPHLCPSTVLRLA